MDERKGEQTRLPVRRYRDRGKDRGALHSDGVTDRRVGHLAGSLIDPIKRSTLILLSNALDKKVSAIAGKSVNIGGMVRYGVWGFTFEEIKELL